MTLREPAPPMPSWLERQLPFIRYRVPVGDGLHMHVMEQGAGPVVLLLHGNPTWGYLYRKVAQALVDTPVRLVIPDIVGLGFSDRPGAGQHQLENHVRWMGALIDALELDDITFVGQDWGGPIGLGALAERAEQVHGLVLLNTVIGPPREDFKPTFFHRFARLPIVSDVMFRVLQFPQAALMMAQGDKRSIGLEATRAYVYPLRSWRTNSAGLELARMVPNHATKHPSIAPLRRCLDFVEAFEGPTAMVWGDRDPVLGSVGRYVQRVLPDTTHVVHTRGGHFIQEEEPDLIADAIRKVALDARS